MRAAVDVEPHKRLVYIRTPTGRLAVARLHQGCSWLRSECVWWLDWREPRHIINSKDCIA